MLNKIVRALAYLLNGYVSPWRVVRGVLALFFAKEVKHQGKWLCVRHDALSSWMRAIFCLGMYELPESRVIRRVLKPTDKVLELGAGAGFVTMLCADIVGAKQVLACEVNAEIIPLLKQNLARNGCRGIRVVNQALSANPVDIRKGYTLFYPHQHFHSASTYTGDTKNARRVKVANIKNILAQFKPTALMMDIEGEELRLLRQIKNFGTLQTLIFEVHPSLASAGELLALDEHLRGQGFLRDEEAECFDVRVYRHG